MSDDATVVLRLSAKDAQMAAFALHIQAKQCEDSNNEFAAHAYRRIAAALAAPAADAGTGEAE